MSELDPLSDGARAAITDELRAPSGDPAMRARVAGRLEAALGAAFAVTAVTATASAAVPAAASSVAAKGTVALTHGKLAAIVAVAVTAGATAGVGVDRALNPRHEAAPVTSQSSVATPQPAPPSVSVPTPVESASAPAPSVAKPPASAPPVASAPADPVGDLARERALIDTARAGLKHGNPTAALDAVQRHAKSFPNGQLREEREGIRILALAALGRVDEAKGYDKKFRAAYPESLFRPQIDAALGTTP